LKKKRVTSVWKLPAGKTDKRRENFQSLAPYLIVLFSQQKDGLLSRDFGRTSDQ